MKADKKGKKSERRKLKDHLRGRKQKGEKLFNIVL